MAYNLDYAPETVSRKLSDLVENGLVEKLEDGRYRTTERGGRFVNGDLDPDALE